MSVDALGNPLRFILTGGQKHDITQAQGLIADYAGEYVIADKGYDAQEFRQHILERGLRPVIPPRSNRKEPQAYDAYLYRERHLVECFINKIKHYRRVFSRFEKLDTRYLGFLQFTAYRCPHLVTVKCQHTLISRLLWGTDSRSKKVVANVSFISICPRCSPVAKR